MRREKGKTLRVWGHMLEVGTRLENEQDFVPCGEGASKGFFMEKL